MCLSSAQCWTCNFTEYTVGKYQVELSSHYGGYSWTGSRPELRGLPTKNSLNRPWNNMLPNCKEKKICTLWNYSRRQTHLQSCCPRLLFPRRVFFVCDKNATKKSRIHFPRVGTSRRIKHRHVQPHEQHLIQEQATSAHVDRDIDIFRTLLFFKRKN